MGTNEYSQPASKSSWDGQDFGDVKMVVKMAHFHKSSRPQWVKISDFTNQFWWRADKAFLKLISHYCYPKWWCSIM